MSNVLVESFGAYGMGAAHNQSSVGLAMLSGAWASGSAENNDMQSFITTLDWDNGNPDLYLKSRIATSGINDAWRRVLPADKDEVYFSFYHAVNALPVGGASGVGGIIALLDDSSNVICVLKVMPTGAVSLIDNAGTALAASSGPVVVAQSAVHMEFKWTKAGVFQLYVSGTKVIDASGLTYSSTDNCAQFRVAPCLYSTSGDATTYTYIGHLIIRDTSGTANNTFPIGDRRVATRFPDQDDAAHQGWTPRPLHRFGVGILDLAVDALGAAVALEAVTGPGDTHTDLGAGDFTIEGQFRFQALPSGSNKAVLFGKWDETNNKRSYQLYLGGPTLENGLLVFRTSTDGLNGTVVEKLKWAWSPVIGHWHHIAMVRASGELLLFIDGVQQGLPVADATTYYAGTALPTIGGQANGSVIVAGTNFQGWQDEFRLSVGLARYTSNFAPPTAAFPRGANDPNWGSVTWLSSWDNAVVADDGPLGLALVARNGAAAVTPNDGSYGYQTIDDMQPADNHFIEAALIPATGLFTLSALPAANDTVTVGTKDGTNAAVYKFVSALTAAYDVLIGADVPTTMNNLIAAIIKGTGEGTVYGTGTLANANVTAQLEPTNQMLATALTAGTAGNSIASTTTSAKGSWGGATLTGGQDIPSYSQFSFQRMPSNTSVVDSITIVARQWKTDAGTANTQVSLVGGSGGVLNGADNAISSTPTLTFDTFEADPDTGGALTPTSILLSKARINRLV